MSRRRLDGPVVPVLSRMLIAGSLLPYNDLAVAADCGLLPRAHVGGRQRFGDDGGAVDDVAASQRLAVVDRRGLAGVLIVVQVAEVGQDDRPVRSGTGAVLPRGEL